MRHHMPRMRRRGQPGVPALVLLLLQRLAALPYWPPVTLATMAALAGVFLHMQQRIPGLVARYCLSPSAIMRGAGQLARIPAAAFLHGDMTHLLYNLLSLLPKGAQLEASMGGYRFAALLAYLTLASHLLYVAIAALAVPSAFSGCAVGFSAVLFGLNVLLTAGSGGQSRVYGFTLPTKYVTLAELLLTKLLVPRSSFLGHACGILAGAALLLCRPLLPPAAMALLPNDLQRRQQRRQQPAAAAPSLLSTATAIAALTPAALAHVLYLPLLRTADGRGWPLASFDKHAQLLTWLPLVALALSALFPRVPRASKLRLLAAVQAIVVLDLFVDAAPRRFSLAPAAALLAASTATLAFAPSLLQRAAWRDFGSGRVGG
eukprot:PLAT10109.2.p2 GENE.PLAT10109.2~~PLAT10109.2.p2  ORF type:complete len:406 (+),score=197.40 PLAT10109.2:96-1220(+)